MRAPWRAARRWPGTTVRGTGVSRAFSQTSPGGALRGRGRQAALLSLDMAGHSCPCLAAPPWGLCASRSGHCWVLHIRSHTQTRTLTHVHSHLHPHRHRHTHTCTLTHTLAHTLTYSFTRSHSHAHTLAHSHTHICTYTCALTRTRTLTFTPTRSHARSATDAHTAEVLAAASHPNGVARCAMGAAQSCQSPPHPQSLRPVCVLGCLRLPCPRC